MCYNYIKKILLGILFTQCSVTFPLTLNRMIVATDANPRYLEFWPIVAKTCKQVLGMQPTLALIADKSVVVDESLGDVIRFEPLPGISTAFQAQVIRLLLPAYFEEEVSMLWDIDAFPLTKDYFFDSIVDIPEDKFVIYRDKAYPWETLRYHLWPVAAKGKVFKEVFNMQSVADIPRIIKEWAQLDYGWSSDERILYNYANEFEKNTNRLVKLGHAIERRIYRENFMLYDVNLLKKGYYIDCHSLRPYSTYKKEIDTLLNHIGVDVSDQTTNHYTTLLKILTIVLMYALFFGALWILFFYYPPVLQESMKYALPLCFLYGINALNKGYLLKASLNHHTSLFSKILMLVDTNWFGMVIVALFLGLIFTVFNTIVLANTKVSNSLSFIFGSMIGLLASDAYRILQKKLPCMSSVWADFDAPGTYLPWLNAITANIMSYIALTCMIMLLCSIIHYASYYWRTTPRGIIVLLAGTGSIVMYITTIIYVPFWILSSIAITLTIIVASVFIKEFTYNTIPCISALFMISQGIAHICSIANPIAIRGNILAMMIIACIAFIMWAKRLLIQKNNKSIMVSIEFF
ncbi:MAG: hypothetical protein NTX86_03485 [Candidatus Dependentiae bacterium]|nr:hypothetical protein [Candidatus Dependentiae bacterium]